MRLADAPDFMRVSVAAAIVGVSERVYYEQARAYLESDGETGLPAVRVGRRNLRVPRAALERLVDDPTSPP